MDLQVILPDNIDDPQSPSGGNRYDRELCSGLVTQGWRVHEHPAYGAWPRPTTADLAALNAILAGVPDDAPVLVDGLIASCAPTVLTTHAYRLRLVLLVHMPFGDTDPSARRPEAAALRTARAIVATGEWTRRHLTALYDLPTDRVRVATPGVAPAELSTGPEASFLCVGVVAPHKGHDVLVEALAQVADLPWTCVCAGAIDRDAPFVETLGARIEEYHIGNRLRLEGPRVGAELDGLYAGAGLLVHPSRGETYGMVAAEALARGIPVLATTAKGLPEAVGRAPDGAVPGFLIPPDDPAALAAALRNWLTDPPLRARLRAAARARRDTLTDWSVTTRQVSDTLRNLPANPIGDDYSVTH
ncbi:glycosyltransferase family 4 protein [Dactylosporangium sp. CA-092794]|uniref:glycosyltransferase family 4 protein n=1 Tax=Dactylosporangium sp. CA-092794 TaxID=3239929 RepID=UPI003D8F4C0B